MMKRLLLTGLATAVCLGVSAEKPNFLFILADDQCWETIGASWWRGKNAESR